MCRPHYPRGAALAGALIAAGCGAEHVVVAADASGAGPGLAGGVGDALDRTGLDLWDFVSRQMAGLAPPPSLVKCVGATIAGSAFALLGMVFEGQRKRERAANGCKEAAPAQEPARRPASRAPAATASPAAPPMRRTETCSSQGSAHDHAEGGSSGSRATAAGSCAAGPAPRGWKPSREVSEVERTVRSVKSILNKLTREKFDTLYTQLFACLENGAMRATLIEAIAQEVFAKATVQHNFIEMYADLCAKLHVDLQKGAMEASQEVSFKRALLDQCQHSFSVHLEPPRIDECLDYEEQYEALVKYKTKMLGNVRFIGNLLRLRMLSPKIIFNCTEELLNIGSPEALETLCAFLDTLGAAFDTREWQGRQRLDEVFAKLELLAADPQQVPRTRCLLRDLLEKRGNHWREWPTTKDRQPERQPTPSSTPIGASPIGAASNGRPYRPRAGTDGSEVCSVGGYSSGAIGGEARLIKRTVAGGSSVGCRAPLGAGAPPGGARPYPRDERAVRQDAPCALRH